MIEGGKSRKMAIFSMESPYKGSGQITREQFLFYEMRTTASLLSQGLDDESVIERIVSENLFQYPTERSIRQIARGCIKRLNAMNDDELVVALANSPFDTAKQICLYAMMKRYRVIWDFMVTVIGEKYRTQDFSFSYSDTTVFFLRLQEQDDLVASWSDSTISKIRSSLIRVLIETDYLDSVKSDHINPVLIDPLLETSIRSQGEDMVLAAFNCFN